MTADVMQARGLPAARALAFCPTPSALARIAALGFEPPAAPSLSVLRRASDRAFCASLGHGLEGSIFATDMGMLERHLVSSPETRFVIKRAFSFAGREQRRVQGRALDASTRGFCARSFAQGEGVQVEPWVDRVVDFSRHGYLTRTGELLVGPVREQCVDAMGRFEGTRVEPFQLTPHEDRTLRDALEQTAGALRALGYFGPFGLDGFRYRKADGNLAMNPRCEVNARFTMGYPRALLEQALALERD
jgi:hypothetical protein